nr:hypothetical protein [uncultured Rhodopila sp.]
MPRALLLTVGTGDVAALETSLFTPLLLSIRQGEWARIVLLPSRTTGPNAEEVRRRLDAAAISIEALPADGAENDADACYDHFDRVIEMLCADGFAPADVVADFTRGTKAMSAALVLAAVRHGIATLRYVAGEKRDQRGMVVPGTERLRETRPARATARRRIDLARDLAASGAFAAARDVLPDPDRPLTAVLWDAAECDVVRRLRPLLGWLAARDRLDYGAAAVTASGLPKPASLPAAWRALCPPAEVIDLVKRLAAEPVSDRLLAIDLLANTRRRVAQGQFEDALVRAYNIVERLARARLRDRGETAAGRGDALDRLCGRNDPIGRHLRELEKRHSMLTPGARNNSILIHGHAAGGAIDPAAWERLLDDLGKTLRRDAEVRQEQDLFDRDMQAARFPENWCQS